MKRLVAGETTLVRMTFEFRDEEFIMDVDMDALVAKYVDEVFWRQAILDAD